MGQLTRLENGEWVAEATCNWLQWSDELHPKCADCMGIQEMKNKVGQKLGKYRCLFLNDPENCSEKITSNQELTNLHCKDCKHCRRIDEDQIGVCLSGQRSATTTFCSLEFETCERLVSEELYKQKIENRKENEMETVTGENMSENFKQSIEKIDKEEKKKTLLTNYPVKKEWEYLLPELEKVYEERLKHWSQIGAEHGFMLNATGRISEDEEKKIEAAWNIVSSNMFTLGVKKEFRRKIEGMGIWRLNMHPGALISAAQKNGSMTESCACLGVNQIYEGTAAQIAFDPNIAVLEPIDDVTGKKKIGFQFVVLDSTGLHAYGGCYTGSDSGSIASIELATRLAEALVGENNEEEATRNNEAASKLYDVIKNTSECLYPKERMMMTVTKNEFGIEINKSPSNGYAEWEPMDGITRAYEEQVIDSAFFDAGQNTASLVYNEWDVSEMIMDAGIIKRQAECEKCGESCNEEDMIDGEEYGLGEYNYYCSLTCVREAMIDAADQRIENVVLIGGEMYELPLYELPF